jgi:hypothetical protein
MVMNETFHQTSFDSGSPLRVLHYQAPLYHTGKISRRLLQCRSGSTVTSWYNRYCTATLR